MPASTAAEAIMPAARTQPLTDDEVAELDAALSALPEENDHLDVVMLDGFLTGVLLQPDPVLPSQWLPHVLGTQGGAVLPIGADEAQRLVELIMRRYNELAACIAAREPFEPIVYELEDSHSGTPLAGPDALKALWPWAAGFANAINAFRSLREQLADDEDLAAALVGILRHMPVDPADDSNYARWLRELKAGADAEVPLESLDEAIADLLDCVLDIAEIARPRRPFERAAPKVGRNDPCPCGSGRKFKHCHGRSPD
jgi:uncharacterized protein